MSHERFLDLFDRVASYRAQLATTPLWALVDMIRDLTLFNLPDYEMSCVEREIGNAYDARIAGKSIPRVNLYFLYH